MRFLLWNGQLSQQLTSPLKVALSANVSKTLLQLKPLRPCRIIEWGISLDANAAGTPGYVELIQTDVAATVTAFVNGDITRLDGEARQLGDPTSDYISVGTSASGFTATAEGTIATVWNLDAPKMIGPTNLYEKQIPLGREGYCEKNSFVRIRALFPAAVDALCYMIAEF